MRMLMLVLSVGALVGVLLMPRGARPQALNPQVVQLQAEVVTLRATVAALQSRCFPAPILTTPDGAYLLAK